MTPRLHIILIRPEIPQNTGNIGRLCAFAGLRLHLIHPLGFTITDRHLRRAGMDYWKELDIRHHESWEAFTRAEQGPDRLWLLTTRGERSIWDAAFQAGDGLVFGNESSGVEPSIHEALADRRLVIPRFGPDLRSLNLSTSAGIAAYEALRQLR
ncbi:MAG: tRNA (cytidine(34)-2'-O)-methyltransferase [Opitutaceae bacterium]